MQRLPLRLAAVLMPAMLAAGCDSSPWVEVPSGQPVYTVLDIPMERFRMDAAKHKGMVLEDRFKFYRIYHDVDTYDASRREQVIEGKTHFTARPIHQYLQMIQIQVTPAQERWINRMGIKRQDVVKARIRFAGIAPGNALAFELLEIVEPGSQ